MNLKDTYNHIAEEWHKDHQQDTWWIEGTDKFVSLLAPGSTVLDAGCGGGFKSRYLRDKGLTVSGIDFSEKMIDIACREVPNARFEVLNLLEVDKLEGKFEGIFVQAALLHIPKKEVPQVLQKLADKLSPEGYLYLAVKAKREGGVDEEIVVERDYGYDYERFFSYFTKEELVAHLENLGLAIVFSEVKNEGSRWIQLIAKKYSHFSAAKNKRAP